MKIHIRHFWEQTQSFKGLVQGLRKSRYEGTNQGTKGTILKETLLLLPRFPHKNVIFGRYLDFRIGKNGKWRYKLHRKRARSFLILSLIPWFLKGPPVLLKATRGWSCTVRYLPGQLVRIIVRENYMKIISRWNYRWFLRKRKTSPRRTL